MTNKEIIFCRQYHNVKIDQLQIIPNQVDNFFSKLYSLFSKFKSIPKKNYKLNSHDGKEVEAENIFKCIEEVWTKKKTNHTSEDTKQKLTAKYE